MMEVRYRLNLLMYKQYLSDLTTFGQIGSEFSSLNKRVRLDGVFVLSLILQGLQHFKLNAFKP